MNYYKKLLITLFLSANTFAFANINMPHAMMVQDDEDTEKEADGSDKYAQRYPDKVARLRSNSHRKLKTYFVFPTILDIADIKINNKINK